MSNNQKIIGYTNIDVGYYDFTWVISNYLVLLRERNRGWIHSPEFNFGSDNQTQFTLSLQQLDPKSSVTLFLYKMKNELKLSFTYKISVIKDDEIVYTQIDNVIDVRSHIFDMELKDVNKFVSSTGTITIHCELSFSKGVPKDLLNYVNTNEAPKLKFDWIFLDEYLSDVILRTAGGKEIPAHKLMLAAASPVFKAMFSHDTLENKSQSVDMIDISYEAAIEMMRYIYTGSLENRGISLTIDLLIAADKYKLEKLRNMCEQILDTNLSIGNAVDILKVADKCNAISLKKNAVDFIRLLINRSLDSGDVDNMILSMERLVSKSVSN